MTGLLPDEQVELPTPEAFLGVSYDPAWDYKWVLLSSVPWLTRHGFTPLGDPHPFYYGSHMQLMGRPHKEPN